MSEVSRARELQEITEMVFLTKQVKLRELESRERRLNKLLCDLAQSARTVLADGPAAQAGADLRWRKWIYQRRVTLNTELAQVRALKEAQTDALRVAFGRNSAAQSLVSRAIDDRLRNASRARD